MKKIAVVLAVVLVLSTLLTPFASFDPNISYSDREDENDGVFTDINIHWAKNAINRWKDFGIVAGDGKGHFMPNNNIKRGDLAIILNRLFKYNTPALNVYKDLPYEKYYTQDVLKLTAAGVIVPDGNRYFRPEDMATREEAVEMLMRAFRIDSETEYESYKNLVDNSISYKLFNDHYAISSSKRRHVYAAYALDFVNGLPGFVFGPKKPITRAEIITILDNKIEALYSDLDKKYNPSGVFKNLDVGNTSKYVVINTSGITLKDTTVNGVLMIAGDGVNNIKFDNANIEVLNCLGNGTKIDLAGANVDALALSGSTDLTMSGFKGTVTLRKHSSGSKMSEPPKAIAVYRGVTFSVAGKTIYPEDYENMLGNKYNLFHTLNDSWLLNLLNSKGYDSTYYPSVSIKDYVLTWDNRVFVDQLVANHNDGITEIGVLKSKKSSEMTYKTADERIEVAKDKKHKSINGTQYNREVDHLTGTAHYLAYAESDNSVYGYAKKSKKLTAYSFRKQFNVYKKDGGGYTFEVVLSGDSIPGSSTVQIDLSTDGSYSTGFTQVGLSLDSNKSDYKIVDGRRNGYVVYTGTTSDSTVKYFGIQINYGKAGAYENFPEKTSDDASDYIPAKNLMTGTFAENDGKYHVKNSELDTSYESIKEYGVQYQETFSNTTSDNWKTVVYGTAPSKNNKYTFSVNIPITDSSPYIKYRAFIRTDSGYAYGETKTDTNPTFVNTGTAYITGTPTITYFNYDAILVDFPVSGTVSGNTMFGEFFNITDNKAVDTYHQNPLSSAEIKQASDGRLIFALKALEKDKKYRFTITLDGNSSKYELNTATYVPDIKVYKSINGSATGPSDIYSLVYSNVSNEIVSGAQAGKFVNGKFVATGQYTTDITAVPMGTGTKVIKVYFKYTVRATVDAIKVFEFVRYVPVN